MKGILAVLALSLVGGSLFAQAKNWYAFAKCRCDSRGNHISMICNAEDRNWSVVHRLESCDISELQGSNSVKVCHSENRGGKGFESWKVQFNGAQDTRSYFISPNVAKATGFINCHTNTVYYTQRGELLKKGISVGGYGDYTYPEGSGVK